MLTTAFVAHRGGAFRGTWLMFAGSLVAFVGGLGNAIVSHLITRTLTPPFDSPGLDALSKYSLFSMSSFFAFLVGLIIFLIGVLALAARYGAVSRRAEELAKISQTTAIEGDEKLR